MKTPKTLLTNLMKTYECYVKIYFTIPPKFHKPFNVSTYMTFKTLTRSKCSIKVAAFFQVLIFFFDIVDRTYLSGDER
jgi:hypothetical protein